MKRSHGFTLVELMISLAIFALMITLAYQSVNTLLDTGREVEGPQVEFQQLQRAMVFVERDMQQLALLRPMNPGVGQREAGSISKPEEPGVLLEFTRGGNSDVAWQLRASGLMRSGLQRVRYVLEDGKLLRQTWNLVDHVENEEPVSLVLLEGMEGEAGFRFMTTRGGEFKDTLPKPKAALVAVEFSLKHKRFGTIRRVFPAYL
jgi:general secretion pathway protein J